MRQLTVLILIVCAAMVNAATDMTNQKRLEAIVWSFERQDNFPDGEPPDIPLRYRDALPEFKSFFERSGWTTNQFIAGLALAVTNNLSDEVMNDTERSCLPYNAVWKLSEINHPAVTNFFRVLIDSEKSQYFGTPVMAMFHYTNLEPEVMAYMRSLCVRTNIYAGVELPVVLDMFRTLDTMPNELKPAATNRVAKFIYFSIHHAPGYMISQDMQLAGFIPAYSNSVQRLDAMRHVTATTTNQLIRSLAQREVDRLSAFPAAQLNNIPWITEDCQE